MIVNFSSSEQLMVTFNAQAEQVLLSTGYDKMSTDDKNSLLAIIANKDNMAFTDITADYILQYHKDLKKAWLYQQRDVTIQGGITSTDGHTYTTHPDDQTNMLGIMVDILSDSTITSVQWSQADTNTIATYTVDDWKANVFKQVFSFKNSQMIKCSNLVTQVIAATTHDALVAITW